MEAYQHLGYDCWVDEADEILSSREDSPYKATWSNDVLFEKIGAKSATIRVNKINIGSGGTGISLVNNLIRHLEERFSQNGMIDYDAVVKGMNSLFDGCDED